MTPETFAIVAPLLGTAILVLFAITMSDRDVAKFQALEAERQSNAVRATISKASGVRREIIEQSLKTTSALTMLEDELVLASIARATSEQEHVDVAQNVTRVDERKRAPMSEQF